MNEYFVPMGEFGEGTLKSDIQKYYPDITRIFKVIKNDPDNWLKIGYNPPTVKYSFIPNANNEDIMHIYNLAINDFRESQKATDPTEQPKKHYNYWYNIFSTILSTMILEGVLNPIYEQMKKKFDETNKSSQQITFNRFKNYLKTGIIKSDSDIINQDIQQSLYSMFIWEFGDSLSKMKIEKSIKKDDKQYRVFNSPKSQKYEIADYSSKIYSGIDFNRLKTLFNECKQLLLFEYNESIATTSSKRDKTVQQAKIKQIDYDNKEITIVGIPTSTSKKKTNLIPEWFHTNPFYLTANKNKYYYIIPKEFNPNDKTLIGIIDDQQPIKKDDLKINKSVTYADTFGAKYDLTANPNKKKDSTFLKKLKKSTDIIGLTGDKSIWKTAMGDTLSAISGDMIDLAKAWVNDEDPRKKFSIGSDNLIRFNILKLFRIYISEIKGISSVKNKDVKDVLHILASYFKDFDEFIKWHLETVNYIMGEFFKDNPEDVSKKNVKKYFEKRKFFESSKSTREDNVMESYYKKIKNLILEFEPTGMEDQIEKRENVNDPKAIEIIGIDNDRVIDDFIDYLVSIKVIK